MQVGKYCQNLKEITVEKHSGTKSIFPGPIPLTEVGLCNFIEEHAQHNTLKMMDIKQTDENYPGTPHIGIRPLLCMAKLRNLTELWISLDIFRDAALTLALEKHPLAKENCVSDSGANCVKRLYVDGNGHTLPVANEVFRDFANYVTSLFPQLSELWYENANNGKEHFDSMNLKCGNGIELLKAITQLSVDNIGTAELIFMTKLKELRLRRLELFSPSFHNTLVNLKRLILDDPYKELNFKVIIAALEYCTCLTELFVCCSRVSHASDSKLANVFQRRPHLKKLEVFYISSMERKVKLTANSIDMILNHCSGTLRRLGQIHTWKVSLDWVKKNYSGHSFVTISCDPCNRDMPWDNESSEGTELDLIPKFFND